MTEKDTSSL